MLKVGIVPDSFEHSHSVPIRKGNCSRAKSVTVDDFLAISICPVISNVFELGVFDRFTNFKVHPVISLVLRKTSVAIMLYVH